MFFKPKSKQDLYDIVLRIEDDVKAMVINEMVLFKRNPDNKTFEQSAIANIALFNLAAITTQKGYEQLINLFQDHYEQMVGRRVNQLVHTLIIRYGEDMIDTVIDRSLSGIERVYAIDKNIIQSLYNKAPGLWLQPFIRKAYFELTTQYTTTNE